MIYPEIVAGPTTTGFISGGREVPFSSEDWADKVSYVGDNGEASVGYPNKQVLCETELLDEENPLVGDADPKAVYDRVIHGPFYPWTIYDFEKCDSTDIVTDADLARVRNKLTNNRSAHFANEISTGALSGSPSFLSVGVPVSDTAQSVVDGVARLIDARVTAKAQGPHIIHVNPVLRPKFEDANLVSNDLYRIVYDDYAKTYTPTQDLVGGGSATAPNASQAWIAITGAYEYGFVEGTADKAETIDARLTNSQLVGVEDKLFYRFDTTNVFLAKVTVFS